MLSPVGRADIGSVFKNSLIFEDGELAKDLVSIPKLDEDGCKIIIEKGKMKIYKNDKIIMEDIKEDGLYLIDVEGKERIFLAGDVAPKNRTEKLMRGHSRLGHRNLLQINKYIKNKQIKYADFPKDVTEQEIKALPLCDSCQRAKLTKRRMRGRVERATPGKERRW